MRKLSLFILIICSLAISAQQHFFTVEIRQPAEENALAYDTTIRSLLLVNNTLTQPDDFGHKNKVNDISSGEASIDLHDAARHCLFGLETGLLGQDAFDDISILETTQNHSSNFYSRKQLSSKQIDSLCTLYATDAVLALNQLVIYDIQEVFLTDNDTYYAYLEVYASLQWTLQSKGKSARNITSSDTLVWAAEMNDEMAALLELPDRQTALLDFAYYAGEHLSRKLLPQWVSAERYLYSGKDTRFTTAFEAFRRQRWQDAINTWGHIYNDTKLDKLQRAYAAANIAVALEMQESFKMAISYADAALKLLATSRSPEALQQIANIRYYRSLLEKRRNP